MSKKLYDQLIEHARGSIRETGEIHHVIPRCLGGTDDDSNLVRLSIHEHIWAHIWLAEMYPNEWGLQSAVSMMVYGINESLGRKPTSEQIRAAVGARERNRGLQSERMSGKKNPMFGQRLSEEHKQKLSEALSGEKSPMFGQSHSEETKRKMSEAKSGENHPMFGKNHSEETRQKMSEAKSGENHPMFGKNHSEETRQKMSEAKSGEKNPMHGKPPWLHPYTLRSPKSLQVWRNADDYFKLWEEHQCGYTKLAKLSEVSVSKTHRNLILKFRAGWVPNEDTEWLKFKETYSHGN